MRILSIGPQASRSEGRSTTERSLDGSRSNGLAEGPKWAKGGACAVLTRVLAALGVGVWCIFILLFSVVFVIDRGLADVGIVWVAVLGIGVAAPVLLLRQINRAIAAHEESRRSDPERGRGEGAPWRPGGTRANSPPPRPRCEPRSLWTKRRRCWIPGPQRTSGTANGERRHAYALIEHDRPEFAGRGLHIPVGSSRAAPGRHGGMTLSKIR